MNINRSLLPRQGLSTALAIATCFSLGWFNPINAAEVVLRTLTVTGQAQEKIPTTLTQVQLGVEIQGETAAAVQQQVAQRTSNLVAFLRSRNVEQLQTTGIQLRGNYNYSDNQRQLLGYIGTNTVSFRVETEQAGNILDEAVKAGATRIDGVSFMATDEAIAAAQKEALRQAVVDAQQQSEAVLNALNFTANEIVSIQVNGAAPPQPLFRQADQLSSSVANASSPVIGGEQTVQASVTLQIRY